MAKPPREPDPPRAPSPPKPSRPPAAPCPNRNRRSSIDLGLEILETLPTPPEGWTLAAIAAVCGVSRERIRQIQFNALKKLRDAARKKGIALRVGIFERPEESRQTAQPKAKVPPQ